MIRGSGRISRAEIPSLSTPDEDGPMIGMRLEAQRRGAEDAMLWQQLRKKDERLHDELLLEVFTNNHEYCNDPERFAQVYERLLAGLE